MAAGEASPSYTFLECLFASKRFKVWKAGREPAVKEDSIVLVKELLLSESELSGSLYELIDRRFLIQHKNIVTQFGSFSDEALSTTINALNPSLTKLFIVEEFAQSCSLASIISCAANSKIKPLTTTQVSCVLYDVCCGLHYLHSEMHTVVPTLSSRNIMLVKDSATFKLSFLESEEDVQTLSLSGRPSKDKLKHSSVDDIRNFGIVALELVAGKYRGSEEVGKKLIEKLGIISCSVERSVFTASSVNNSRLLSIPPDLLDFIACCLRKNASVRPTAEKLLEHSVFHNTSFNDADQRRRNMNPLLRASCLWNEKVAPLSPEGSRLDAIPAPAAVEPFVDVASSASPFVFPEGILSEIHPEHSLAQHSSMANEPEAMIDWSNIVRLTSFEALRKLSELKNESPTGQAKNPLPEDALEAFCSMFERRAESSTFASLFISNFTSELSKGEDKGEYLLPILKKSERHEDEVQKGSDDSANLRAPYADCYSRLLSYSNQPSESANVPLYLLNKWLKKS